MPLFIPTSDLGLSTNREYKLQDYFERYPVKGQIYNLDDDKKIYFQFNPEEFEHQISYNWADINSIGTPSVHHNYLGQSERSFELPLLFISDPGMPPLTVSNIEVSGELGFDQIYQEIENWLRRRDDTGLPSILMTICGQESYTGFVRELRKRILDQYEDGSTRRGLITIQFQEWRNIK